MRWAFSAPPVLLVAALLWVGYGRQAGSHQAPSAVEVEEPEPPAEEAEPAPPANGAALRGIVLRPRGVRASGAIVHANLVPNAVFAFADGEGEFALPVPPEGWPPSVDVVAEHDGLRNLFTFRAEDLRAAPLRLELTSCIVRGRVLDGLGRPVPWATVEVLGKTPPSLWRPGNGLEMLCFPSPTAADGRFELQVQRRDGHVFVCRAKGFAPDVVVSAHADLGDIVLREGITLRNRVTDGGLPVAGAWVVAEVPPGVEIAAALSGDDGWFTLLHMPKGVTLIASSEGETVVGSLDFRDARKRPAGAIAAAGR